MVRQTQKEGNGAPVMLQVASISLFQCLPHVHKHHWRTLILSQQVMSHRFCLHNFCVVGHKSYCKVSVQEQNLILD